MDLFWETCPLILTGMFVAIQIAMAITLAGLL